MGVHALQSQMHKSASFPCLCLVTPSAVFLSSRPTFLRSCASEARPSAQFSGQNAPTLMELKTKKSVPSLGDESQALPSIEEAKRVVLVRHGQSTWNEEGRIQGSSDFSVLTHKGVTEAETARQMLLDDTFNVCFHSPLARSKRTAEIIWDFRKGEMIPDNDLREIDLYSFQGLLKHEGKQLFGEAYSQWQKDASNFVIDGHYPVRELWQRAKRCWKNILSHKSQSILVVAHNAVNQALVSSALGLGPQYFRVLLQSNCGVSVLDFTPNTIADQPPYISLNRLNQAK
eukprot:TRINITY_DN211_c0_g1_i1.p1 TRINITY_DN211_c0_g1~~TRINITY_DN211_c0_g1_i1.p1  ORF type:complete len:309 (+),score=42.82 TRINITY_DN211_c0_g1_i1:67-927(+)